MQYSPTECNKDLTKKMARTFATVPEFELVYKIDLGEQVGATINTRTI